VSFRDGPLQDLKIPLAWTATVATIVAGVAALALLLDDQRAAARTPQDRPQPVRSQFDEAMAPVSSLFAAPLRWAGVAGDYLKDYFDAVEENRRLKAEMASLLQYREKAFALKNINARYEALLKLRTEPEAPMVSARVVDDVRGGFAHMRLIDAGADQGVKIGNPVLSEHGVVGRVVGVSKTVSRVMLLTDVTSRTAVLVNSTNARAILAGDGGDAPKLSYLRGKDPVKVGDVILTSGDGGLYPRGLPVGVADQDVFHQWRVRLYSDRSSIDYVRVMLFSDFSQLVDDAALNARSAPPVTAAEKAQIEAAVAARTAAPKPGAADAQTPAAKTPAAKAPAAKTPAAKIPAAKPAPANPQAVKPAPAPIFTQTPGPGR